MKYKLLAMDVDDTLIFGKNPISKENLAAIKRAEEAGIFVTVATGRCYQGSKSIFRQFDLRGYIINYGGAVIRDTRTDEIVYSAEMPNELVHEALEYAREQEMYVQLYDGDTVVVEQEHPFATQYTTGQNLELRIDPLLHTRRFVGVPKVLYMVPDADTEAVIEKTRRHFEGRLKVAGSKSGYVELNALEANKGTALKKVADLLGVSQTETAAIGDNSLDEEMIEWAGLGAAVGNAQEYIKSIANVVVKPCTEHGVADFIDNYILK